MGTSTTSRPKVLGNLKPWQIILIFAILLCVIYGFGSFTFDYFAGAATAGFGVWGEVGGVGMYFTYIMAYFIALVVVLPILVIRRFWVGMAVYALYALSGLYLEYYFELVLAHNLVSYWSVIGWCALGLSTGLSADLTYRFLPSRFNEKWRAIVTGLVVGMATFLAVTIALSFFYIGEKPIHPGTYLGVAYYGLPFMLVNSGFGGYTAYAISRRV